MIMLSASLSAARIEIELLVELTAPQTTSEIFEARKLSRTDPNTLLTWLF